MSGYTLQRRFEDSVAAYWSVTQSQIYRELRGLAAEGFVRFTIMPGEGKPAQKVYAPTTEGLTALERWLAEPVEPQRIRHPLLLKLSFAGRQDPRVVSDLLEEYGRELGSIESEYLSRVGATRIFRMAASPREAILWKLILDNGLSWVRAERAWAERSLKEWKEAT